MSGLQGNELSMSSQLGKIGSQTLVYTAGIIIGKVASFVMLPVYTRYLTPADYGVLELLGMTIDVIGMITGIGLVAGVFKFYSAEEDAAEKNAFITTAAIGVVGLAAVTSLIGWVLAPELSRLIFGANANPFYLRLYFLLYLLQNFEYVPLLLIRAENRSALFVTVNAAKLVAMLSLNILFVVYLRMGIEGVLASGIITSAAMTVGLTFYLIRRVGMRFSVEKFRRMLRFGSPMVLWSLGTFILVFSDRFFLNHYTDTSTVGIYSLAYKFAFLLSALAFVPFETVWDVQRFEIAKRPDAMAIYARVFLYMNVMLGGVAVVLCLLVRDFLSIMSDPAFLPAYRLVPLLVAAQIVFTWASYWNVGLYISGKTRTMATGAIVLVPITLILNYLLISRFGIYGAAWATLAVYGFRFCWIYYFAQRNYPIPYQWMEITKLYGILGAAVALRFAYRPDYLAVSVGWGMSLLLATMVLVYKLVLSDPDRATFKALTGAYSPRALGRRAGNALRW
jgi:O-antigen/teichoic acid export membrane protein